MPFTPFHLGPAFFFGLLFLDYFHFLTFVIANVIVDIEPLIVIMFGLNYPLHGVLHSFISCFLLGVVLSVFMFLLYSYFPMFRRFPIFEYGCSSFSGFVFAGVFGTFLHVLLDAPLYIDIRPFLPLEVNPLYNPSITFSVYLLCVVMFVLSLVLYFVKSIFKKF